MPRAVVSPPVNVIPFGWKRKTVLLAELPPPAIVQPHASASPVIQPPVQGPAPVTTLFPDLPVVLLPSVLHSPPAEVPDAVLPLLPDLSVVPDISAPVDLDSAVDIGASVDLDSAVDVFPPEEPFIPVVRRARVPRLLPSAQPPSVPVVTRSGRQVIPRERLISMVTRVPEPPIPGSHAAACALFPVSMVAAPSGLLSTYLDVALGHARPAVIQTFNTQRDDELDLDQMLALLSVPVTYLAPLPSSVLLPVPSTKCKEVPLRQALRSLSLERLEAATVVEVDKQRGFGALGRDFSFSELPKDAVVVHGHILYKDKHDDRFTCRIAAMGDRLEPLPSSETFASVVADGSKNFAIATMQAYCASRGEFFHISDADVVGGFLHIPLTSPVPLYLLLPPNLPHPLAGRYLEIKHAIYGLRESNRLFGLEMSRVITVDAGFTSSAVEPQLFVKDGPPGSGHKCIASVTVDDVLILTNSPALRDTLLAALTARFGQLTVNLATTVHTGIEFTRLPSGGVQLTQDKSIARAASLVGVSHLPSVAVPSSLEFFDVLADSLELVSVSTEVYASLTGKLVQFLKTRHEVRLLVSFLCSQNQAPREGHYRRAIHVLRYLASSPGVGPVYCATATDFVVFTDAAFGVVREHGLSTSAHVFSIGRHNAPFAVSARPQCDVATCPFTAEYYAVGSSCRGIIHYRQLGTDLGFTPSRPTVLYLDNKTSINMVVAPQISLKSRHIEVHHHYIRQLHSRHIVQLVHVPSCDMRANVLSKVLSGGRFLRERDVLLNRGHLKCAIGVT